MKKAQKQAPKRKPQATPKPQGKPEGELCLQPNKAHGPLRNLVLWLRNTTYEAKLAGVIVYTLMNTDLCINLERSGAYDDDNIGDDVIQDWMAEVFEHVGSDGGAPDVEGDVSIAGFIAGLRSATP